jgi:Undecaprenyl-phosphate galactose phosphotransferase WbaP
MASESRVFPFELAGQLPAASSEFQAGPLAAQPLDFRERRSVPWLMALADVTTAQVALHLGVLFRAIIQPWLANRIGPESYRGIALALLGLPLACWLMGLYPGYGLGPVERLRRRVMATAITFTALIAWDNLVLKAEWSRSVELFAFAFAVVLFPLVEAALITTFMGWQWWGTPVIVLSSDNAGARLVESLHRRPEIGLVPIGMLKDRPETWGKKVAGMPVLGPISLAPAMALHARTAVVAMPDFHRPELPALFERLPFPRVIFVPNLPGMQSLWTTVRDLGGTLGIEFRRNLMLKRNYRLKRVLDYAVSVPFFLASVPLIAFFALWIKRVSPGPAFYTQEREGHHGRKIRVWKLRTMFPDAERLLDRYLAENPGERAHWQRFFKLEHDPRILPGIGRLLRKTSLDELPQLWNILKGEMSLVGPRPFPEYHMNSFGPEFRELRHSVPPGLTGFWQISERSDADTKLQEHLDTYYIRNWSLWLDVYILTRTVKTVLLPRGAY